VPADEALLAQILSEVRSVGAKVSGIEVTVARAVAEIGHRSTQADDHEVRLRALEAADNVTRADMSAGGSRFREWGQLVLAVSATVLAVVALLVKGT
jgi:hypothetical protein